jgi:predicted AlkP superfamily pyrophosphatase or phosphodiesterase
MVSFDGFRADYLDRYPVPNLHRVIANGARAEALIPAFPSKTFPNHYTIATGLTPEHHGIVANAFYDPARRDTYSASTARDAQDGSWYRGEPIWVTAERQGMVTGAFVWPGSEAAIQGIRPTHWKPYDQTTPDSTRVDSVLSWLRLPAPRRPHLVVLYMGDVDVAAHRVGPDAPEVSAAAATVDAAVGRLLDGMSTLPIADSLYLVLVSDHGLAAYTANEYVAIERLVDTLAVRVADVGPVANLHVTGGVAAARVVRDSVNRVLGHGRAYLRGEVPSRLHYSADPRIGDVVIITDEPYVLGYAAKAPKPGIHGLHGWDPASLSMHAIFVVQGPGIPRGVRIPAFENVDIYPWLTEVLGLQSARSVDGQAGRLRAMLMDSAHAR